jgi:transcriptional regulator with XRE-family HTH domain
MIDAPNLKAILAIKIKRLRKAQNLTLSDLADRSGLSVSYLAEIEAGKKYPKPDRLLQLAASLSCSYDELTSTKLEGHDDVLQTFLSAPGVRDFPFEMFGVPAGDVMKLLTRSPAEVAALLRALTDIARQHDIGVEHFVHAALRSYQELTGNYCEDIETKADDFALKGPFRDRAWDLPGLRDWVTTQCGYAVDEQSLGDHAALRHLRAVVLDTPKRLLLNPALTEPQKAFLLAREVGHFVLGFKARPVRAPSSGGESFEQVRNDFHASYFAGALLLPRGTFGKDLQTWLRLPTWQPEALLRLLDSYHVTPETLMYRASQLIPSQRGLNAHFFKFTDEEGDFRLIKQLNLTGVPVPQGIRANEHYCRRWLSTRLLSEFREWQRRQPNGRHVPLVGAQYSRFIETDQRYFCMGLSFPEPLRPDVVTSLIVGFRPDDKFYRVVRFAKDRTIPTTVISGTCERCGLSDEICSDRVAPPVLHQQLLAESSQRKAIADLAVRAK